MLKDIGGLDRARDKSPEVLSKILVEYVLVSFRNASHGADLWCIQYKAILTWSIKPLCAQSSGMRT